MILFLVFVFGALGCIVRYVMEFLVRLWHPTRRPWGTVAANFLGTALAGWATYRLSSSLDDHLHSVIVTGFCGGLTTASSALAIPVLLAKTHHWKYSAALILSSPVLCAVGFFLGMQVATH
jgi:fluoride exporter